MAAECRVFTHGVAGELRLEDKPMKDRWIGRDRHQENCALLFMLDRYKTLLYDPTILALSLLIPAYFCLFCLKKQKKQNCSFPDAT